MELGEFVTVLALLYFLPILLAMLRDVSTDGIKQVAFFNILFGWIPIVWFTCLVMALVLGKELRHDN